MTELRINQQIAALRKSHHMTQEELAGALGVTNQTISKWESAQCCPDIQHLPALAKLFGVSVGALLGCEPPASALPSTVTAAPDAVLRTAATLHITALCSMTTDSAQMHLQHPEQAAERAVNGQWGYSCLCAPELTTTMRGSSVFFSNNRGLDLRNQSLRSIASLLKPFGNAVNLRVLSALYSLTMPDESFYASMSALSEATGLPQQDLCAILEGDLSPYLEENDHGFRIAGMYMNLLPIFSLLDFK